MQELVIEQVKFCGVEKINPVFIFVGQNSSICWGFTATENHVSNVARISDEDTCQVFSFLSEASETPHFQADGDMCHVAGFEPDTPSCPFPMESRWLCKMIPAIATRTGSLFLRVSVWLVTCVSNGTSCKILIIKLNISSSTLSKI